MNPAAPQRAVAAVVPAPPPTKVVEKRQALTVEQTALANVPSSPPPTPARPIVTSEDRTILCWPTRYFPTPVRNMLSLLPRAAALNAEPTRGFVASIRWLCKPLPREERKLLLFSVMVRRRSPKRWRNR